MPRHLESKSPYTGSAALLGFLVGFGLVLLTFPACPGPASAEKTSLFPLGASGLVKADLTFQLYQGDLSTEVADPGVVLVEDTGTGWYQWTNLPDVATGDDQYHFRWTYVTTGYSGTHTWPLETRTPQAIVNRLSYSVTQNPLELFAGATVPSISLTIKGLAADPTGATATFTLWTNMGTATLTAVAATVSDIDQLADGTWEAVVTHEWTTVETAALSGTYYGRFTVTLPGGGVLVSPPAPSRMQVRVYP